MEIENALSKKFLNRFLQLYLIIIIIVISQLEILAKNAELLVEKFHHMKSYPTKE
jgi:hypothetical protein